MQNSENIGAALFAVAGLILLCTGLMRLLRRRRAEIRWIRREAVMSSQLERPLWGRVVLLDPVMSYTVDGNTYVARIRTGDAGRIHQLGGRYNLLCSPQNPELAIFELDHTDVLLMRGFMTAGCALLGLAQLIPIFSH